MQKTAFDIAVYCTLPQQTKNTDDLNSYHTMMLGRIWRHNAIHTIPLPFPIEEVSAVILADFIAAQACLINITWLISTNFHSQMLNSPFNEKTLFLYKLEEFDSLQLKRLEWKLKLEKKWFETFLIKD